MTCQPTEHEGTPRIVPTVGGRCEREAAAREREEAFRRTQKMEALGSLAGGIAHELNNLLQPIVISAELALDDVPPDSGAARALGRILNAAGRAGDLVGKILTFGRTGPQHSELLDLGATVSEAIELIRPGLPETIELVVELAPIPEGVRGCATDVHQILMNLAANAVDAMVGQGVLEVTLTAVEFGPDGGPNLPPGRYVRLCVADQGFGMDPETQARIFEPFFTTKDVGAGTGLGLALVHSIVAAHGGAIMVDTELGRGSVFEVYLPAG